MYKTATSVAAVLLLAAAGRAAWAGPRRIFEPTDLNMQPAGWIQLDAQLGMLDSPFGFHTYVPDYEIDLGVSEGVELDLDGALALAGAASSGKLGFERVVLDNVWLSTKLALFDRPDAETGRSWVAGLQLGPKLPTADAARGVGYEALFLVGRKWPGSHVIMNLGGMVDPGATVGTPRPAAFQLGIDLDQEIGPRGLSVLAEFAWVEYVRPDPADLHATAGFSLGVFDGLDVSLIGFVGLLRETRQRGGLLGVTQHLSWL